MNGDRAGKLEAIVFDFDGTLAELHLDFGDMKRRLGVLAGERLRSALPPPTPPALEWLEGLVASVQEFDVEAAAELRRSAHALIVDMELEAAHRGRLFPFTRPMLEELRRKGIKVAIITRNCERAVRIVFPDMNGFCAGFLARDHVPSVKPDPDHLLRALRDLDAATCRSLMVGDHPLDIQTGQRAGTLTAGVWSGSASEADLARSGAGWTARNCEELIRMLEDQGLI